MKTNRNTSIYLLVMVVLTAFGLPARTVQDQLPAWYVQYFGDYLWAMLLFFWFALLLPKVGTLKVAIITLLFTYSIEISQLFHPQWLQYLRSIKLFGLILGYGFLRSDIVAYTLGISTGALIERFLLSRIPVQIEKHLPLILIISGILIIFGGFVYDVLFAGIPYQDPTPALTASYNFHSQLASIIRWSGVGISSIGIFSIATRKKENAN